MRKIKLNKRIIIILVINISLIIFGLLYPSLINKNIVNNKVTTYIENLINNRYTIDSLIKTNLINNLLDNFSLFLFTLLIFTFPVSLIIYLIKPFSLGLTFSSIIYIYKLKGVLYALLIVFPTLLNLLVLTITFYYSISYFIIILKYRKKISRKRLLKGYLKVFLITTLSQIVISFFDSYLSYYLFKLFGK